MANSTDAINELLRRIDFIYDPPPEWLNLDRNRLSQFAKIQIEFKIKELQIQQDKLQRLQELM